MKKSMYAILAIAAWFALSFASGKARAVELDRSFADPPDAARPWVYWFWLNGNITSNGITADLEAMKRVGIGGVLIMEVDQGTPKGPADFGKERWRGLFKHVCAEANRLGLEVNMNNDAGWCGSGGPWITPELAMQKIVWSETNVAGPKFFEAMLPKPTTNYYRDIAVLAFPTPPADARIDGIQAKAAFLPQHVAPSADWPAFPAEATIPAAQIVNLSAKLGPDGRFSWDVPEGKWTLIRFGHTPTGKDNHPAPEPGRGLESDKLSKAATDAMFAGLMEKLITDSKPLAGRTLAATHIDSWETGSQNWSPRFREDFKRLRGYDVLPFLPVITGRIVDSAEISERFLWDLRQTVSDLLIKNYAGRFHELAHKNKLRLSIEAYDGAPCDEMTYAGQADEPMAEFWSWRVNTAYSCTEMASAAHVYGKRILGAEAFTATDEEKWLHHPASIKALGDWAFCEGINRFVFHRYALQPWPDVEPGMSMGPWGLHYERTQTWWEQSAPWHEYLTRCQFMLRQGLFVADICFLQPEGSPRRFLPTLAGRAGSTPDRPGYNFDGCTPEVVMTRMKAKDGKLVLPDGMSYRMLVLPEVETMTPALLRKIKSLVEHGATVVGPPPRKSPSLMGYPDCDREVNRLARELWGTMNSATGIAQHNCGQGRVIWGADFSGTKHLGKEEPNVLQNAKWIWHNEGNPAVSAPPGKRYFRHGLHLDAGRSIVSARFSLTADNSFELWVNGERGGSGDSFSTIYTLDVARLLKSGDNLISIAAENATDQPNPAGWIGALSVRFESGPPLEIHSDASWQSATNAEKDWILGSKSSTAWSAAMELGSLGMQPWGTPGKSPAELFEFPEFHAIANLLASMSVPPDFEASQPLRYIHRRDGETDIYFVANPANEWRSANCTFRVSDKTPEIWNPLTGETFQQPIFEEKDGRTTLPLRFEPAGSQFVVFRNSRERSPKSRAETLASVSRNGQLILPQGEALESGPAPIELRRPLDGGRVRLLAWQGGTYDFKSVSGRAQRVEIAALPSPLKIAGPWSVTFQAKRGSAETFAFQELSDWALHTDPRVKYFSGSAVYSKRLAIPPEYIGADKRLFLELGRVAVIAEVKLNGRNLGVSWREPFTVDVTEAAKPGENELEIKVVNLWVNRMIGDEQLPEDSARNRNGTLKEWPQWLAEGKRSPTGRSTFTSWRLWKQNSPLQESGLLGPVRFVVAVSRTLEWKGATAVTSR